MLKKIIRHDYPAQIKEVSWIDLYANRELNQSQHKGDIVIIARELLAPFSQDSALNLYYLLLNNSLNVSLLILKRSKKFERFIKNEKLPFPNIKYLEELEKILQSPIAEGFSLSYQVNLWLTNNAKNASTFVFIDSNIDAYFTLLARKSGIAHSRIKCILYSPTTKHFDVVKSSSTVNSPKCLNIFYCERVAMELADAYISSSQHYLNWMNKYELNNDPINAYYNEIPHCLIRDASTECVGKRSKTWFFIFGVKDEFEVFFCLDALMRMGKDAPDCVFTFPLGLQVSIKRRMKLLIKKNDLNIRVKINSDLYDELYNTQYNNIIVPSKESLPSALFSYFIDSNRVVLSNELYSITTKKKPQLLSFNNNPEVIKEYFYSLLSERKMIRLNSKSFADFESSWVELMSNELCPQRNTSTTGATQILRPTVTVCISHFNRGYMLMEALNSVLEQTYTVSEVIIVDDGSNDPEALKILDDIDKALNVVPIHIIRQPNLFIGASRNNGLKAAKSEYILFMDDDNVAMPNEVESFVKSAIITKADITTCLSKVFSGRDPISSSMMLQTALFIGPNISNGLINNPYGDSNMFARVDALKSIDGFSQHYKIGRDDQELLSRACLNGLNVSLLPLPLYYYRLNNIRIRSSHINHFAGLSRVMQAYEQSVSSDASIQLMYLQSLSFYNGPWGISNKSLHLKLKLMDMLRIYVAKFPKLYIFLLRVQRLFS